MVLYEVSYVWQDKKDKNIDYCVFIGIYSQKEYAKKAIKKIKKKKYCKKLHGEFYLCKVSLDKKVNDWFEGYVTLPY